MHCKVHKRKQAFVYVISNQMVEALELQGRIDV